jgi:hypothetical protein
VDEQFSGIHVANLEEGPQQAQALRIEKNLIDGCAFVLFVRALG